MSEYKFPFLVAMYTWWSEFNEECKPPDKKKYTKKKKQKKGVHFCEYQRESDSTMSSFIQLNDVG
jgi:hypothetical protein